MPTPQSLKIPFPSSSERVGPGSAAGSSEGLGDALGRGKLHEAARFTRSKVAPSSPACKEPITRSTATLRWVQSSAIRSTSRRSFLSRSRISFRAEGRVDLTLSMSPAIRITASKWSFNCASHNRTMSLARLSVSLVSVCETAASAGSRAKATSERRISRIARGLRSYEHTAPAGAGPLSSYHGYAESPSCTPSRGCYSAPGIWLLSMLC